MDHLRKLGTQVTVHNCLSVCTSWLHNSTVVAMSKEGTQVRVGAVSPRLDIRRGFPLQCFPHPGKVTGHAVRDQPLGLSRDVTQGKELFRVVVPARVNYRLLMCMR